MIGIIGINHKTAPVEIREIFVFNEEDIAQLIAALKKDAKFDEVVILSTCNRTEVIYYVYGECSRAITERLIRRLVAFKKIENDLREHFYTYTDREAVEHLFQVAAGLDSLVLGENQILGQIKSAYRMSAERKYTGTVLNKLFHRAFEAGKRVRNETSINKGASSVGYAAVEVAFKIFGDLGPHPVLLIGAGETGEIVMQSLAERGSTSVYIANRTRSKAESLAAKYNATVVDFAKFKEYLTLCDIIITSTASPIPLIQSRDVRESLRKGRDRSAFFIDLSVPRDVSDDVRNLENVFLYDIDDLQEVVAHNYEKRKSEIQKAVQITEKMTSDFLTWMTTLNLVPTIASLKEKINGITESELKNICNKMTDQEHNKVTKFAYFLNKKYLNLIIKNLKALSNDGMKLEYVRFVNDLFELTGKDRDGAE